jgi:hypothetical protein
MSYKEDERDKAVGIRDRIFKDPGNGLYRGKEREFVLSDPSINLWEGIRLDAIEYFKKNKIAWWNGNEPTGHLLSSQIACLNHLYPLRQREDLATEVLRSVDKTIEKAAVVDNGFVEFEFIGDEDYLGERSRTRGANCTSIDAAMIGVMADGTRKLFLIEWKYTETYAVEDKYVIERSKVYDDHIVAVESPFRPGLALEALYYEPFYQLMRQTLLAEECIKHADHGVGAYTHVHVVPEKNVELKKKITSPTLVGKDIHDAWRKVLKDDSRYIVVSPEQFLQPLEQIIDTKSHIAYLKARYW